MSKFESVLVCVRVPGHVAIPSPPSHLHPSPLPSPPLSPSSLSSSPAQALPNLHQGPAPLQHWTGSWHHSQGAPSLNALARMGGSIGHKTLCCAINIHLLFCETVCTSSC